MGSPPKRCEGTVLTATLGEPRVLWGHGTKRAAGPPRLSKDLILRAGKKTADTELERGLASGETAKALGEGGDE